MRKLFGFTRFFSIGLIIAFFSISAAPLSKLPNADDSPECGDWVIESEDDRLGISKGKHNDDEYCSALFTLENKTGTHIGGGYSLALNTTLNSADVEYVFPGGDTLIPGLILDFKATPADISRSANIAIQGGINLRTYLGDAAFFLLRVALEKILPVAGSNCLISHEELSLIALRTAPILKDFVNLVFSGHMVEAVDELSRVQDIFFEKAWDYSLEMGISCLAKSKVPIDKVKLFSAFWIWWSRVISDYWNRQDDPAVINISYLTKEGLEIENTQVSESEKNIENLNKIIFTSDRSGNWELYSMNLDGTNQKQLTNHKLIFTPSFDISPDGNTILYEYFTNDFTELFSVSVDGGPSNQLTNNDWQEDDFSWSPDGSMILFDAIHGLETDIFIMDKDGSNIINLTDNTTYQPSSDAVWSPDRLKIAFFFSGSGSAWNDLFIMNMDGSDKQQLTNDGIFKFNPKWAPDGQSILYSLAFEGENINYLNIIDVSSPNQPRFFNKAIIAADPKWSNDGSFIYFQTKEDGNSDIYTINPIGEKKQKLTDEAGDVFSVIHNGNSFLFVSNQSGHDEIYELDASGRITRLTNTDAENWHPTPLYISENSLPAITNEFSEENCNAEEGEVTYRFGDEKDSLPINEISQRNYDLKIGSSIKSDRDGMKLLFVPEGEFTMGFDEYLIFNSKPEHNVFIDSFWIDQTEVTNAKYELCVEEGKCNEPEYDGYHSEINFYKLDSYSNYPVSGISWYDAKEYCLWAGRQLPTEAEWEKAARGTEGYIYPWGHDPTHFCDSAVIGGCEFDEPKEVKWWGGHNKAYFTYDLVGNVAEWVSDWYDREYYMNSPYENPSGPIDGSSKIVRGGSFAGRPVESNTVYRDHLDPDLRLWYVGFRCALSHSINAEINNSDSP